MTHEPSKKESPVIPSEILALIQNPPLLKGESRQDYYNLLGALVRDIGPIDLPEWLWLISLLNCVWEIFRNARFRVKLIDLNGNRALKAVIQNLVPEGSMCIPELKKAIADWNANPGRFENYEIDPETVPAMALSQLAPSLENIDKMSDRLQRRWERIQQQLDYRREMFAHRARKAADAIRNEIEVQEMKCVNPGIPEPNLCTETTIVPETPPDDAPTSDDPTKESADTPASNS